MKAITLIALLLLLPVLAHAQQGQSQQPTLIINRSSRFNRNFWLSSAVFGGGCVFDFASTRGLYEKNNILTDSRGQVSGPKFLLVNGGIYALSVLAQKNHPRAASIIRYIAGAAHFGIAIHNYGERR